MIQFNMSQTIKISSILNILVREKKKKIENNMKENIYYKSKQKYMLLLKCLININKEIKFSRIELNNDNYSLKRRVNNKIECRQLKQ